MQRLYSFGLLSLCASTTTIFYALLRKNNFYNACVFLYSTTFPMLVLLGSCLYSLIVIAFGIRYLLFGNLRSIEVEHLWENGYFTVSEIFLAMTIFREDFNVSFMINFLILLIIKSFHWTLKDRADLLEQTSNTQRSFLTGLFVTITLLAFTDGASMGYAARKFVEKGPSIYILFGTEYAILLVYLFHNVAKIIFTLIDLSEENPWEEKSTFLFYTELITDAMKLVIYLGFFALVTKFYGLPIHIIRDLYFTVKSFITRIRDLIRYKTAVRNLQSKYPDATPEELQATDMICIICRDEMTTAKKLPCGHYFHMSCLKSWIERQQVCPTCRRPIFQEEPATPVQTPTPLPQPQQQQPQPTQGPLLAAEANGNSMASAQIPTHNNAMLPIILLPNGQIGIWNAANQNYSTSAPIHSTPLNESQAIERIEVQLYNILAELQQLKQQKQESTGQTE